MLTSLDAGDSIVVVKSFSHMLNLAEEVQNAYRRRIKLKKVFSLRKAVQQQNQTLKKLSKGLVKEGSEA